MSVIICDDAWCTVWAGCAHIKYNVCRIFKEIDGVVIVLVLIDVLFIDRRSGSIAIGNIFDHLVKLTGVVVVLVAHIVHCWLLGPDGDNVCTCDSIKEGVNFDMRNKV